MRAKREHHGDGMLRRGNDVAVGRVHHQDAAHTGGIKVHVVHPDSCARNHLERLSDTQKLIIHPRAAPDDERVRDFDGFEYFLACPRGVVEDFKALLFLQYFMRPRRERLANQNAKRLAHLSNTSCAAARPCPLGSEKPKPARVDSSAPTVASTSEESTYPRCPIRKILPLRLPCPPAMVTPCASCILRGIAFPSIPSGTQTAVTASLLKSRGNMVRPRASTAAPVARANSA